MDGSRSSSGSASTSINDLFYEIADGLSQRYHALSPFDVRREKFGEVIRLIVWINGKGMKEKGIHSSDRVWNDRKGDIHIRREAKNDNWW